jgi:tRNA (cytidine/uridine-2'-O-)-methyltransferase
MLHIVLYQPEIPHNTGAIGRLCLATGAQLHLIHPLGFSLDDRQLKRAGLDYWKEVDVHQWQSLEDLLATAPADASYCYLTTKTQQSYWTAPFHQQEVYLLFGPETRGLPESLLQAQSSACYRIPMAGTRSLNLATAVGIVLYEAIRQQNAAGLTNSALL